MSDIHDANRLESDSIVGSCDCLTKTDAENFVERRNYQKGKDMNELKQLQDIQDEMRKGYAPEKTAPDYGEPWKVIKEHKRSSRVLVNKDGERIARVQRCSTHQGHTRHKQHAGRIKECVNACAGISDPSNEIARLRLMQWIPLAVALPSKEDGDGCEDVEWCVGNDIWTGNYKDSSVGKRTATHWRRIVLP